jgi:hypothetical protein
MMMMVMVMMMVARAARSCDTCKLQLETGEVMGSKADHTKSLMRRRNRQCLRDMRGGGHGMNFRSVNAMLNSAGFWCSFCGGREGGETEGRERRAELRLRRCC